MLFEGLDIGRQKALQGYSHCVSDVKRHLALVRVNRGVKLGDFTVRRSAAHGIGAV